MEEKKGYYAIIPASVRYDKSLTMSARMLYGEITALCNANGYCYASNNYFAKLYEVTPQAISKWINMLANNGYLRIEYIYSGKEIVERHLYILDKIVIETQKENPDVSTEVDRVSTKVSGGINKRLKGYQQKIKENNTNIIINNNNKFTDSPNIKNEILEVEKSYLENYKSLYEAGILRFEKPILNWGVCRKLEKDVIKKYGLNVVLEAVEKSKDNQFCIEKGYVLTTILSAGVFAGLVNGASAKKKEIVNEQFRTDKIEF